MSSAAEVRGVALLGATGSIGETARRVLARHADRFRVVALTANGSRDALAAAAARLAPAMVGLVSPNGTPLPPGWRGGPECLVEAATHPDAAIVLNAVVGAAGLDATLAALRAGKRVALANKESLVMGGALVQRAAREGGGAVVPVDSEHSALLQCVSGRIATEGEGLLPLTGVRRVVITASGGPFRTWSSERIRGAQLADALAHPTWSMGRKITVDSASLANKALEVIEAHVLFGVPYDRIEVVVHPQSIVHSMVEFDDGSVLAQLGVPSMELPILYSLTYPDRLEDPGVPRFDPVASSPLTFESVRDAVFPTLGLGIAAGRRGGAAPAVFNAANEAAVARFLDGSLDFPGIPGAIGRALERLADHPANDLPALLAADAAARAHVKEYR
ncbi:MAG: 1-deoxy-D-xylulose-5-phosphate reductoisomerase [Gemmatimonadales bacterium]|nr:1-deoxy-D-xylulose-5-phosphate reductoisomerase [Gemmatimonadota bacterium]MCL4213627.1 1-deoxy-D-xylulose-5-phosphate reductoisomerase [Gemmatimonadales bacterium]